MLERARKKGLRHTIVADAMRLPFPDGAFNAVTVAFGLRNMESWPGALREMRRVLTEGGHLLVLDFSMPGPPFQKAYRFYLHHILPAVAGILTRERAAYKYLGDSIERFPAGKAMLALLEESGFQETGAEPLTGGIVTLYAGRAAGEKRT